MPKKKSRLKEPITRIFLQQIKQHMQCCPLNILCICQVSEKVLMHLILDVMCKLSTAQLFTILQL
jgi:hypothetical protein